MTNYLLLYKGGTMPDDDADKQKTMEAWSIWMKRCGDNLVDAGNPCSEVKSVNQDGVTDLVSGDRVTGYSVIKADSMDDAVKAAQMVPLVVNGTGSVDVYATFDVM